MKNDFSALQNMIYSGRGITIGITPNASPFIGYTLTGRSPPSQARKLVKEEKTNTIRTDVIDKEQLEKGNPALLLYPALTFHKNALIASNGAQTQLLYSALQNPCVSDKTNVGRVIDYAFDQPIFLYDYKDDTYIDITTFEPDAPNNTPRISALLRDNIGAFHLVNFCKGFKENKFDKITEVNLIPGKGKLMTTYSGGNETPLAPFDDDPLDVIIRSETANEIVEDLYNAIGRPNPNDDNKVYRVSAAVMMLKGGKLEVAIRNRSEIGN